MLDFISIGDTTLDVFLLIHEYKVLFNIRRDQRYLCVNYADKVPVDSIEEIIAGNAANAAVAASRAGLKSAILTQMGDDKVAQSAREMFQRERVSLDYFITEKGKKSNYSVVVAVDGERTILIYHTRRRYLLPRLKPAKWVYLTSMSPGSEKIFSRLVKYIHRHQVKLVYQPGTFQLRSGVKAARRLLQATELLVLNRQEAVSYSQSRPQAEIKELLDKLTNFGPKMVIITDGTKGSYCFDGKNYWKMGILKQIPRREATGAGDAYASGVAIALAKGKSLTEAMRWGHFNSSSVIQYIGAQKGLLTEHQYQVWSRKYRDFVAEPLRRR